MILNFKNSNRLLYHYTKIHIAIDYILTKRNLKIGSFTKTNDPKETKEWKFNLGTNRNRDLSQYNMAELSAQLSKELKEKTKLLCFSKDREPLTGNHLKDIFNRGYCKPRMWVQYAENHTGVCLVFDKERLNEILNKKFGHQYYIFSRDVDYVDRGVVPNLSEGDYTINIDSLERMGLKEYSKAHLRTFYKRFFFEKLKDWRDENEYRWVLYTDVIDDLYIDIGEALRGVVFGENTDLRKIDKIMNMTEELDIEYTRITWKNCSPWYDYEDLRYVKNILKSPWSNLIKIEKGN